MRLKSEIWVKAYVRRCTAGGAFAFVVRHGDDDAGAIFIKVVRADGQAALFAPAPAGFASDDADGDAHSSGAAMGRRFVPSHKGQFVADGDAERALARERQFDSDLWVVEVEDREGRHFLGDELIA